MISRNPHILALSLSLTLGLVNRVSAVCDVSYLGTEIARFSGECDVTKLDAALARGGSGCVSSDLFASDADVAAEVAELCRYDAPVQFAEIQGTYQLDRRYMNGGGPLIDSTDGFNIEAGNIRRFQDNVASKALIGWPEYAALVDYNDLSLAEGEESHGYPSNFDLTKSCELNTVMCCFIDDALDTGFGDDVTTDVCHHDLGNSPQSNHIKYGWSFFDGAETDTHCVGFTWTDDSQEDAFKGNALFDVSLANTVNKGYYKSVPGAPLCACIEQMPVVETAACRTATGSNLEWVFSLDSQQSATGGVAVHATNEATITYEDCAEGDLAAKYKATHTDKADLIDAHLVGTNGCHESNTAFLNEKFYVPGRTGGTTPYASITQDDGWVIVAGEGVRFLPPDIDDVVADTNFRALIGAGCTDADGSERHCIIRRFCDTCVESHRDIYYKRLTNITAFESTEGIEGQYFLDVFLNNWYSEPANALNVDFELYSTYDDAIAGTNQWLYCNYNDDDIGFPRDCGPTHKVNHQWTAFEFNINRGSNPAGHAYHAGFYVELP